MPYGKPPTKKEMSSYRKAQKAVMGNKTKTDAVQVAFRKKHDYQGTKKTSVSKPKPPPIPANKKGKRIKPTPTPAPPAKKVGRLYQYVVYLPEDYSDWEALDYWEGSSLVSGKSGVKIGEEDRIADGNIVGTYHTYTAKKLYTIKEWNTATKGRPSQTTSETGKNYGYRGGIVKSLPKKATKAKATKAKARKPPPKIQGLDWKMTDSVVKDGENYWEWSVYGADWIENAGDTTTYTYEQDPIGKLWHGAVDSSMRAGRIFDDEGMEYTVPEFRKEYKKLQKKMKA